MTAEANPQPNAPPSPGGSDAGPRHDGERAIHRRLGLDENRRSDFSSSVLAPPDWKAVVRFLLTLTECARSESSTARWPSTLDGERLQKLAE
jgi:hypothetical protein